MDNDAVEDDDLELTAVGSQEELASALTRKGKAQRPWLVVVSGGSSVGKMYRIEGSLVIGRSPQCEVHLDRAGVSRRHAMIERSVEGNVQVVDLESRNGTFVNGEPVSRQVLGNGDKIQIGLAAVLKFAFQDELDEALQRNLYESATRDPLTGAVNRRGFDGSLAKECSFALRHKRPLSLLTLDVDHFKRVNDTRGHPAGDHVLKRLAEVVTACIRREDVFARIGGEEFAVILRDIALASAVECAERLRASIERAVFEPGGARIPVTVSIGVATLLGEDPRPEALVDAADRALYQAKHSGRNRVCAAKAPGAGVGAEG